jgi:hypothetical protein
MARAEFSKATKRAAYARSERHCEAEGEWYGLPRGQRCNGDLRRGVEYDHLILDANSHDNSLENCRAVCPKCHLFKTRKRDTPLAAKTLRQSDRNIGIKRGTGRGFPKPPPGYKHRFGRRMGT